MSSKKFKNDLDNLEREISKHFSELLTEQSEFTIFEEVDLENDTPDDYLECRNNITGGVFDVHPIKVTQDGILVIESDGSFVRHIIRLDNLSCIRDRIILCELMENSKK